jgi:hypothetical protein
MAVFSEKLMHTLIKFIIRSLTDNYQSIYLVSFRPNKVNENKKNSSQ